MGIEEAKLNHLAMAARPKCNSYSNFEPKQPVDESDAADLIAAIDHYGKSSNPDRGDNQFDIQIP